MAVMLPSPVTPNFRLATDSDLTAVQEIIRAAYTRYIVRIGCEPLPMLYDYAALISEGRVHVVERDGVVRGVLMLIAQDDAMLLDNIAVAPEAQGSGFGRLMLEFAERAAIEAGYTAITLCTNEAMTENIALYTRIGYAETHRAEVKGRRAVYMRKPLAKA